MKQKLWITLLTYLAYCVDKELYKAIGYLKEQVRVLVEQQEKQASSVNQQSKDESGRQGQNVQQKNAGSLFLSNTVSANQPWKTSSSKTAMILNLT